LAAGGLDQADHAATERRLSATGLADKAQGFAFANFEIHATHGFDASHFATEETALDREGFDQVFDLNEGLTHV
jgi:hypothetical protein